MTPEEFINVLHEQLSTGGIMGTRAFLRLLTARKELRLIFLPKQELLLLYYMDNLVASNLCPCWKHATLPPPTMTIGGIVLTTYDIFSIPRESKKSNAKK